MKKVVATLNPKLQGFEASCFDGVYITGDVSAADFDTIDDEDVARALIERAEAWLKGKGMKRAIGPLSLYANDEIGLLIEGFEHPPVLMMAHSRAWQARLAEACGYTKEKDLWCWYYHAAVKQSEWPKHEWRQRIHRHRKRSVAQIDEQR